MIAFDSKKSVLTLSSVARLWHNVLERLRRTSIWMHLPIPITIFWSMYKWCHLTGIWGSQNWSSGIYSRKGRPWTWTGPSGFRRQSPPPINHRLRFFNDHTFSSMWGDPLRLEWGTPKSGSSQTWLWLNPGKNSRPGELQLLYRVEQTADGGKFRDVLVFLMLPRSKVRHMEEEGFERSCKHISVPEGTLQSRWWGMGHPAPSSALWPLDPQDQRTTPDTCVAHTHVHPFPEWHAVQAALRKCSWYIQTKPHPLCFMVHREA